MTDVTASNSVEPMPHSIADWNKWSRIERVLAVIGTAMSLAIPLQMLIRAATAS